MSNNHQKSKKKILNSNDLINQKVNISFFPNPAHKTLFIECDLQMKKAVNLIFINKQGVPVLSIPIKGRKTETNIGALPTGVYNLKIEGDGFNPIAHKLVKI